MVALVDRKVTKFFASIDGLVKKTENDKYFVVFQHKYLEKMEEEKFSLLEDVKSIKVGNEMSVTLSMGIGYVGNDYTKNYEYSRMAIDLALGRGGDQVVVNLQIIKEEEFSAAVDFAPCKCMLVSDDEEALLGLEDHWKRRLNGALDVFRSEPYFLEVVPCAIDKANSLGALLEVLGMKREEVIAVGDGVCDVTMIQLAGLGVAMGHSQDSVKACADYVTASNEEDGVAVAVEKAIIAEVRAAEIPLDQLNAQARHALMGNLGIQYTYADEDRVEATMPVDHRTRQPFGILHGGATLALAETVAGLGSMILCQPDEIVVGMQVSGNHISSAHEGDTVRAVGTVVHKGRSSHVWNVDVFTSTNKLVSSIRVVNSVMKKR